MRSEKLTRTQRARRDDVIVAAISVINADGYAAASVERIATAAATSKSTVLYHFKSREAINEAVVRQLFDNGAAYMTERIMAVEAPADRLTAYLSSNLRFIAENAPHVNAVHKILSAGQQIETESGVAPLTKLLVAGQEAGAFGAFDAEVMALAIRAIVDAASFHFTENPDLDVEHYIDEAVQLFGKATAR